MSAASTNIQRDLYATVLRNIANSAWNAGRDAPITVQEYAAEILHMSPPPARECGGSFWRHGVRHICTLARGHAGCCAGKPATL